MTVWCAGLDDFEVSYPRCVDQLYNQKNVLNIWSEHNYILSHRLVHTTICFGPVYWPSSGCNVNLISNYTICAWNTLGRTRSRLTVVGGMALDYYGPVLIQGVPLATEPGISLIILTRMKILQRNLNRSTFFSFTFLTQ